MFHFSISSKTLVLLGFSDDVEVELPHGLLCIVDNTYILYYICPLHTFVS